MDYPYGSGLSVQYAEGTPHTKLKHLYKQYGRYLRFVHKFFEKHTNLNKTPIWFMGDSQVADFLPSVINHMIKITWGRETFDRVKGIVLEAPTFSYFDYFPMSYMRAFNLISENAINKIQEK